MRAPIPALCFVFELRTAVTAAQTPANGHFNIVAAGKRRAGFISRNREIHDLILPIHSAAVRVTMTRNQEGTIP